MKFAKTYALVDEEEYARLVAKNFKYSSDKLLNPKPVSDTVQRMRENMFGDDEGMKAIRHTQLMRKYIADMDRHGRNSLKQSAKDTTDQRMTEFLRNRAMPRANSPERYEQFRGAPVRDRPDRSRSPVARSRGRSRNVREHPRILPSNVFERRLDDRDESVDSFGGPPPADDVFSPIGTRSSARGYKDKKGIKTVAAPSRRPHTFREDSREDKTRKRNKRFANVASPVAQPTNPGGRTFGSKKTHNKWATMGDTQLRK